MDNAVKLECDYVVKIEHIISYGKTICDASTSFIEKRGPAASRLAYAYFKENVETEYTNVYGVTNIIHVLSIYRRV